MRLYIAGPMSGLPEYNYPAFNRAEDYLRSRGYETLNPARNPKPEPETWEGYMRAAVAQVVQADGIALLEGSHASRGARLEMFLAGQLGIPIKYLEEWPVQDCRCDWCETMSE